MLGKLYLKKTVTVTVPFADLFCGLERKAILSPGLEHDFHSFKKHLVGLKNVF